MRDDKFNTLARGSAATRYHVRLDLREKHLSAQCLSSAEVALVSSIPEHLLFGFRVCHSPTSGVFGKIPGIRVFPRLARRRERAEWFRALGTLNVGGWVSAC